MKIHRNRGQSLYCSDIVEEMILSGQTEYSKDIFLKKGNIQNCSTTVDEIIDNEDNGVCSSIADEMLHAK
jgi:hypothetical protein